MNTKLVKIVIYVPLSHAAKVRVALAESGAGHIGTYDSCSFSTTGTGRFRPQAGAKPAIGAIGNLTSVDEERIETICPEPIVAKVVTAVKSVHPYEVPAIDIYPLLNDKYL